MYFLGVDGGGTKTSAMLLDTTRGTVRSARLGSGNLCVLGHSGCMQLLEALREELLEPLQPADIHAATFAFAGAGRSAERAMLESVLAEQGYRQVEVMTDAQILHYTCFGDHPGMLIAAGTGSIGLVTPPEGGTVQIGGRGYILGDEGSGFHIGKLAMARVLDRADSRQSLTDFDRVLLKHYQVETPQALITTVYTSDRPQSTVASCAAMVDEQARERDADAIEVIRTAAGALATLAQTGMTLCQKTDSGHLHIALAGGILNPDTSMVQVFRELMDGLPVKVEYRRPLYDPAAGAVLHAAAGCDGALDETCKRALLNSIPDQPKDGVL